MLLSLYSLSDIVRIHTLSKNPQKQHSFKLSLQFQRFLKRGSKRNSKKMGNTIPQASASPLDLRTFLVSSSLPKSLIVTSKLSDRKFIKTLRCKFEDEDVVLKVHFREKATERSNEILRHMTMLEKRFRASVCVLPYRYYIFLL